MRADRSAKLHLMLRGSCERQQTERFATRDRQAPQIQVDPPQDHRWLSAKKFSEKVSENKCHSAVMCSSHRFAYNYPPTMLTPA
jgi:hypothetical protein